MNNSTLTAFEVVELKTEDARQIQGGWWHVIVTFILLQALVNPEAHLKSFLQGFKEGFAATE